MYMCKARQDIIRNKQEVEHCTCEQMVIKKVTWKLNYLQLHKRTSWSRLRPFLLIYLVK